MAPIQIVQGAELPSLGLTWLDDEKNVLDLSSGFTFSLRIGTSPPIEKTAGITGAATAPNVTIDWTVDEFDTVEPGVYSCQLWATRTSDSKDRVMPLALQVIAAIPVP